jgi:tetratricopeptide (TPR) repeat protein
MIIYYYIAHQTGLMYQYETMKKAFYLCLLTGYSLLIVYCKSGLVTTSNSCYNLIQSSQAQNRAGDYSDALANFNEILKKCDSYDAKLPAYAGKAEALNGLHQYNEALAAANEGLKIDKASITNLFEKASAELGLGMNTEAKADLQTVVSLTEKNRNTAQRATIYAKMAALDSRQKQFSDAENNIRQAISLDPNNLDLLVLQGDIFTAQGKYSSALESYNLAISKGKNDGAAWQAKVESIIKMNQAKYGTNSASTLSAKMNASDKKNLCEAIQSGIASGMKNMDIELTQSAICK